jgi:hypothetical protein
MAPAKKPTKPNATAIKVPPTTAPATAPGCAGPAWADTPDPTIAESAMPANGSAKHAMPFIKNDRAHALRALGAKITMTAVIAIIASGPMRMNDMLSAPDPVDGAMASIMMGTPITNDPSAPITINAIILLIKVNSASSA